METPDAGTLAELASMPTPDLLGAPSAPPELFAQPKGSPAGGSPSLRTLLGEPGNATSFEPPVQMPNLVAPIQQPQHRSALDKKFWLLAALTTALTTTDIEFTQHCLHNYRCVELDPLMPHSRAGMYAATYPANALFFYWSYRRREAGKRLWWLAPIIDIGSHSVGTWSGARFLK